MRTKITILPLLALALAVVPLGIRANDIEPTKEKYTAAFAPRPITIDGILDEWGGVPILADPKFAVPKGSGGGVAPHYVLFEEYGGGTWSGPDDQTSAVQVAYDADNVYFGFVVTDDTHENAAHSAWNGDSIQLMIANGTRTGQVALYNYALGGVDGAIDSTIIMHEAGPGGTTAVVTRDEATKKTYYEIQLPASSLGLTAPLTAGTQFGLGMAINDGDTGPGQAGQKGWGGLGAHSIVFGKTPGETALVTLAPSDTVIESLGVGATALLLSPLTDPENDGLDAPGAATDPSWNWTSITASVEPDFGGGEFAFNIFDHKVGGGNDKWCCDDPTPGNPVWVSVGFGNPVSLTHFTVTSGNDTPGRDPTDWAIQGSADGAVYTDIYHFKAVPAPWTQRNEVLKFTLPFPAVAYRNIRYIAYDTPANLHQINEIEYFGVVGGGSTLFLSAINPGIDSFTFRATSVGGSVVAPATAKLIIDGATKAVTAVPSGDAVDFSYLPTGPYLPGSDHTYSIEVKDTLGNKVTSTGVFKTVGYALLTPADKVTPDTTKPGFIWNVQQNNAFQANNSNRAENQLAGLLGENFADPAAQGVAIAPGTPGDNANLPVMFEIETVINMSQVGGDNNGSARPDDQMPGIPGTTGGNDGIAGEIRTYLEVPKGKYTMVVNSDDGFVTSAGDVDDIFLGQVAGRFDGGRGANDSRFTIYAQEAGVYCFRTVWYEGGGGANIEWKVESTIEGVTTQVLLNDVANGGFAAYRTTTTPPTSPYIKAVSPAVNATRALGTDPIWVIIQERVTAVDNGSVQISIDGSPATPVTVTRDVKTLTAKHQPAAPLAVGLHKARVRYTYGGKERTAEWSFTVPPTTLDTLHKYPGIIVSTAGYGAGQSGAAGDYSLDLPAAGSPAVFIPDGTFVNATTADDVMTFSLWVKKLSNGDSSAFWAESPSSNNGERGFQAHIPWSNNNVYFDTAGCCGADTRISGDIATFPGYTDATWWTDLWHHWLFVKDGVDKHIYVDGQLWIEGLGSAAVLPTDFRDIWVGAGQGGGSNMRGQIDDFAIFGTALSLADAQDLAAGTRPTALAASTKLLALWEFNDKPAPKLTITRSGTTVTISWPLSFTGYRLRGANAVTGPWADVAAPGNTATVITTSAARRFYYLVKP